MQDTIIDNLEIPIVDRSDSFPSSFGYAKHLHDEILHGMYYRGATSDFSMDDKVKKSLRESLEKHEAIKKLEGQMICYGNYSTLFNLEQLVNWFIWYSHTESLQEAKKALKVFLSSSSFDIIPTLWIVGIIVEEKIKITDDVHIVPIDTMPHSVDKEYFKDYSKSHINTNQNATSALIFRSIKSGSDGGSDELSAAHEILFSIAHFLNLYKYILAVPCYSTSYPLNNVPCGPFGGSGGSGSFYDIQGYLASKMRSSDRDITFIESLSAYLKLDDKEKNKWNIVSDRLMYAKSKKRVEDQLLDLTIALEMLLFSDNNKVQLKLSFRLRGSLLIGKNTKERKELFEILGKMYDYRSSVAHSGKLEDKEREKVQNNFENYLLIAERICFELLKGTPDWDDLILNKK